VLLGRGSGVPQVKGVKATAVNYAEATKSPTYKRSAATPPATPKCVQVEYDPAEVSYDRLLGVFWVSHDPTQRNRQGPDVGTQYRTVIFFHTPEQEKAARESKAALEASGRFPRPIATEILPAPEFWLAEDYHQQYLEKRGLSTCRI
jgi:peptide-methionine (S)-S-oxide reductase